LRKLEYHLSLCYVFQNPKLDYLHDCESIVDVSISQCSLKTKLSQTFVARRDRPSKFEDHRDVSGRSFRASTSLPRPFSATSQSVRRDHWAMPGPLCRRTPYAIPPFIKCPGPGYHLKCYRNLNPGHPGVIAAAGGPGIAQ
jgi:hypothetical protein